MRIEILCSSPDHPVNPWLERWMRNRAPEDTVRLVHHKDQLQSGDVLFLISVSEIIGQNILDRFSYSAVVHSSNLPEGRGWNPHVWEIVNGARKIVVSALVAEASVDTGRIWEKQELVIPPDALHDEINSRLFETWMNLMTRVCTMIVAGTPPQRQPDIPATYWPRRSPADSELDPEKTITEQFDLMRVCDPIRYPAFFKLYGYKYKITLEKLPNDE